MYLNWKFEQRNLKNMVISRMAILDQGISAETIWEFQS
jgi:hypothetical protein